MAEDNTIYGFNAGDADQLIRMIGGTGTSGGSGALDYDATKLVMAVATSGVPARSGTTLGKASVAIKYLGISGSNRVVTDLGQTVDAYNLASVAVAANTYVLLLRLGDVHLVIWEEC